MPLQTVSVVPFHIHSGYAMNSFFLVATIVRLGMDALNTSCIYERKTPVTKMKRRALTMDQILGGLFVVILFQMAFFGLFFYAYWQLEKYLPVSLGYLDELFAAVSRAEALYNTLLNTQKPALEVFRAECRMFVNTTGNVMENEEALVPCFTTWHGGCD